jgi:hypothetical protein
LPAEALDGVEQEGGDDALAGLGDSAAEGSQRECPDAAVCAERFARSPEA